MIIIVFSQSQILKWERDWELIKCGSRYLWYKNGKFALT